MVLTSSYFIEQGTPAPEFTLPDSQGVPHSLSEVAGTQGVLVAFISNHCPYVKHLKPELAALAKRLQSQNIGVVAINANDIEAYPADRPELMWEDCQTFGYLFPYLFDESQQVAKAYHAACTPDFFLYDADLCLVYHGQFDDSRPGNDMPVTGASIEQAAQAMLSGEAILEAKSSVGCNIKWKS